MNLLLFQAAELGPNSVLTVRGDRASHLKQVLKVQVGTILRVGLIGAGQGTGEVVTLLPEEVQLRISDLRGSPSEPNSTLVLAMPRPQSLKKVLQTVATLGIAELVLIGTARVEKAYFSSPLLREANLNEFLHLGMEQGMSTWCPRLSVFKRFQDFSDDFFTRGNVSDAVKLVLHPQSATSLADLFRAGEISPNSRFVVAIGPEGGWIPRELETFESFGFQSVNISKSILRVETAVNAVLAQLELLQQLRGEEKLAAPEQSTSIPSREFHGKGEKETVVTASV